MRTEPSAPEPLLHGAGSHCIAIELPQGASAADTKRGLCVLHTAGRSCLQAILSFVHAARDATGHIVDGHDPGRREAALGIIWHWGKWLFLGRLSSLWALATLAALASCSWLPLRPPADPLPLCAAGAERVPAIFNAPAMNGLSRPALDASQLARIECLEATAALNTGPAEDRLFAAQRSVADAVVNSAGFFWWLRSGLETQARYRDADSAYAVLRSAAAEMDLRLDGLYRTAVEQSAVGIDQGPFVALALFDWARLVRQHHIHRAHTVVAALREAPFCAGDAVVQRLLWRYLEAASRARTDETARADVGRALHAWAVQMACLGDRQLFRLDRSLSLASLQLEQRLAAVNLSALKAVVEPYIFQARLLVFDALKHRGVDAPSFRWWLSREGLRASLGAGAVYPLAEGLWLYDRRSGVLTLMRTSCADGGIGSGCVNLQVFGETLTRTHAFGMGECSFLEMIEGGVRSVRGAPSYTCTGGLCGTALATGRIPATDLASTFATAWGSTGGGYRLPAPQGDTPFGVPYAEAQASLCGPASGGGFGGQGGGAGGSGPGMGAGGSKLACVVGVKAERTAALVPGMACFSRFLQATSPLQPPQERMQATGFAGVPGGCQRSDGGADAGPAPAGGGSGSGSMDATSKAIKEAAKATADELKNNPDKIKALRDQIKAQTGSDVTDAQVLAALTNLSSVSTDANVPKMEDGKVEAGHTSLDGDITINTVVWAANEASGRADKNRDLLLHEFVHSLMNVSDENRHRVFAENPGQAEALGKLYEEADQGIMKAWGLQPRGQCVADDVNCRNGCNGLSAQARQALACLDTALNPQTIPPRPIDLVTDPIDPSTAAAADMQRCFAEAPDVAGVVAARFCGTARCANSRWGLNAGTCCIAGGVLLDAGAGLRLDSICPIVLCASSIGAASAMGDASSCGCSGAYTVPPGTPLPRPPETLPFPLPSGPR